MDENSNKKKVRLGLLALLLLLLIGSCTILNGLDLFKSDNSMSITENQDNLPSSLAYAPYEQNESFIGAQDGEGEITYVLIRALDERGIYVDYFSLLNDKSTQIVIAPNTPAGTYELLIRATAAGDGQHKPVSKEFTIKVTVNKADSSFDELPTPIEGLIYTGDPQNLINPGSCSTGTIYYKVDDGDWSTQIPQATDVGTYTVYYKVEGDKNHNDIPEQSFTVTIETAKVGAKPSSLSVDYDGQKHSINYTTPAHVSKSGDASGTNAGEYKATYTPEGNYVWNDGTKDPVTVTLTIKRAAVNKPSQTSVTKTYNGSVQDNGYSKPEGVNMSGDASGTNAGVYKATYTPDENHVWSDGTSDPVTVTLTINKYEVDKPEKTSVTKTYNGSVQYNDYEKPDSVNMSGDDHGTNAGTYTATYTPKDNYIWSDGTSDPVDIVLTINRAKLNVPKIIGIDTVNHRTSVEYDGGRHHPILSQYDRNLISVRNTRGRKNAGEYTVTVSLKKSNNYEWADGTDTDKELTWTITPKKLLIPKVSKTFVYTPNYNQSVKERDLVFYNRRLMSFECEEQQDAGEYTLTVSLKNTRDYCWLLPDGKTTNEDQQVRWVINKAANPLEVDNVQIKCTSYSYYDQSVSFEAPKADPRIGDVTYKLKKAVSLLGPTDDITIDDNTKNELNLKPKTSLGIYEAVVTVYAEGDKNHLPTSQDIYITLTVETLSYKVVFDSNAGGDAVTGQMSDQNIYGPLPGALLNRNKYERDGYVFDGWYTSTAPVEEEAGSSFRNGQYVTTGDLYEYAENGTVTLYAQWKEKSYVISYDLDGGSFNKEEEVVREYSVNSDDITITSDVKKPHYTFVGWTGTGIEQPVKNPIIEKGSIGDREYKANWTGNECTIILIDTSYLNLNDIRDSEWEKIIRIVKGHYYGEEYGNALPGAKEGYDVSWRTISGTVNSKSIIESGIDGASISDSIKEYIHEYVTNAIARFIADGIIDATTAGIDSTDAIVVFATEVPLTNTPYTVKHYVQDLSSDGKKVAGTYSLLKTETRFGTTDAKVIIQDDMSDKGIAKRINGFYLKDECREIDDRIKGDGTTEIALYYDREIFAVSFDSQGGPDVEIQLVPYNGLATDPGDISYGGNTFCGWYYNGTPFDFNTRIKNPVRLTAMWNLEDVVNVVGRSSDPTAGEVKGSGAYKVGEEVVLTALARDDYRFVKWNDNVSENPRTFEITEEDLGKGMIVYTAQFEQIGSRSMVNTGRIVLNVKPGDEIDVTEYFVNLLLVSDYSYTDERSVPFAFDIDKSLFGSKALVTVDKDAAPGTYQTVVTVRPYLIDLTHDKSSLTIVVNVTNNEYIVTFDANGGTPVANQSIPEGENAREPVTVRDGYEFFGWHEVIDYLTVEEEFDFNTPITKDTELIAVWKKSVNVSFNLNGGTVSPEEEEYIKTQKLYQGEKAKDPGIEPVLGERQFAGWYLEDEWFNFEETEVYADIELRAEWYELDEVKYRITVNVDLECIEMGEVTGGGLYDAGESAVLRAIPGSGYRVAGWRVGEDEEITLTGNPLTIDEVLKDETYTVVFEEIDDKLINYEERYFIIEDLLNFTIELYPDTVKFLDASYEVVSRDPVNNNPLSISHRNGLVSKYVNLVINTLAKPGIYSLEVKVSKDGIEETLKLTAEIKCKVSLYKGYGIEVLPSSIEYVRKGEKLSKPDYPTRNGYVCTGWYDENNNLFDFNTVINEDIKLTAKWKQARKVTFDPNNGSDRFAVNVADGYTVDRPEQPVYDGYTFMGWYQRNGELISDTAFDFDTPIGGNVDLVAVWNKEMAVRFDSDGGTAVATQTVLEGDKAVKPADPAKLGYEFAGWHEVKGEAVAIEEFDFNSEITDDISLQAKWTPKMYQVVYDSRGGTPVDAKNDVKWTDNELAAEHNPSSYNPLQIFTGWYLNENCTIPYRNQTYADIVYYNDEDMSVTLYAGWFDRGIIRYTAQVHSTAGKPEPYNIKDNGSWYLLLSEYEIIDGNNSEMFTMSADHKSITITDQAAPGTYYVRVTSKLSSILDYLGIGSFNITDYIDLPVDLGGILDTLSQTIMIEWTVDPVETSQNTGSGEETDLDNSTDGLQPAQTDLQSTIPAPVVPSDEDEDEEVNNNAEVTDGSVTATGENTGVVVPGEENSGANEPGEVE